MGKELQLIQVLTNMKEAIERFSIPKAQGTQLAVEISDEFGYPKEVIERFLNLFYELHERKTDSRDWSSAEKDILSAYLETMGSEKPRREIYNDVAKLIARTPKAIQLEVYRISRGGNFIEILEQMIKTIFSDKKWTCSNDVSDAMLKEYEELVRAWKKEKDSMGEQILRNGFRIWCASEFQLVQKYIDDTRMSSKRIDRIREIAQVVDRTENAVERYYYSNREAKPETKQDNHLLDVVSALFQNFDKLRDFELTGLLEGLRELTQLALENREAIEKRDARIQELETTLSMKDRKQERMDALFSEFEAFGPTEKISRFKEFYDKLWYEVQRVG